MATKVFLGVGSNLNRENSLRFAVAKIGPLLQNFSKSSVWISHPVRVGEPDYYNMVLAGETQASITDLYACLQKVEQLAGTEPMFNNGTNFGLKRRLDIDILTFGNEVLTEPCKVPRHDIQDYPFVLAPLCELDPELVHPLLNIKVKDIWAEMEPRIPEGHEVTKIDFDWSVEAPAWNNVKD